MSFGLAREAPVQSAIGHTRSSSAASCNCLLFDFGGTLDADGVAWKERFEQLYRAEGVRIAAEEFARLFYGADDALVGRIGLNADLPETARRLTVNIEPGLALSAGRQDLARAARVAERFLDDCNAAVARNRGVLKALRARYRLGIVSNFYGNLGAVCAGLGLGELFDVVVDSHQAGVSKPDPAIFHAAMGPLAATPESTLMVGDSLHRDREGARLCGLGFIWITSPQGQAEEAALDHPTISSLGELVELLL